MHKKWHSSSNKENYHLESTLVQNATLLSSPMVSETSSASTTTTSTPSARQKEQKPLKRISVKNVSYYMGQKEMTSMIRSGKMCS